MGGFIVLPKDAGEPIEQVESRYAKSLAVFQKKNLELDCRWVRDDFVAYRYKKMFPGQESSVEFANGDFVFSTGTFIYDNHTGSPALKLFFDDFVAGRPMEHKAAGNFTVVVFANGELSLISDYCGYHPVFLDEELGAVSSSFMALARAGSHRRLNPHAMYEFLLHGFFVGAETLLSGIRQLDSRNVWRIRPNIAGTTRTPAYDPLPTAPSIPELVETISAKLGAYFSMLARLFPGDIGLALSGGYDSRHMTALLTSAGVTPYLYVYGGATSSDVRVALNIAKGEGLDIEHTDKSTMPKVGIEAFAANIERDLYFFDGIKPLGVINDGTDLTMRLSRAGKARLQLNGAGGEIYREIWNLADRSINLESFLRLRYDRASYKFLRQPFDSRAYFSVFSEKVRNILGIERASITRKEAEMLFPFLRNRFASNNNLANSQISDTLLPFMETQFVFPSFDIPIRYKYCGNLHAALIRAKSGHRPLRIGLWHQLFRSDPLALST